MDIASMLAFISDWSTPSVLFIVLNLMIATIFLASNHKSPNDNNNHDNNINIPSQLTRSPSLLERVKSMKLPSLYTTPEPTEYNSTSQLSPRLSLLQRVKSIDISFSSFNNSCPTESDQLSKSPSERSRSPSFIDRVKSFKLISPLNSDQHSGDTTSSKDENSDIDPHHDSLEDNSVTNVSEKSAVTHANRSLSQLRKSSSEKEEASLDGGQEVDDRQQKRRPVAKKKAVGEHDESVDAKADDFIKRFKQQLKLQRLDSLQRLKEMLNRGT